VIDPHQHSFAQISKELGCKGVRIERPTDIGSALQNALASGKPVVLDVLTDPTASHPRAWTPPALTQA
jgi:acetolactate synthase I/II/III large subunit